MNFWREILAVFKLTSFCKEPIDPVIQFYSHEIQLFCNILRFDNLILGTLNVTKNKKKQRVEMARILNSITDEVKTLIQAWKHVEKFSSLQLIQESYIKAKVQVTFETSRTR